MELGLIAGNDKRLKSLENKGIDALEDMAFHVPTKYYDFREIIKTPTKDMDGEYVAIQGKLVSTYSQNKPPQASFKLLAENGKELRINYFGSTIMEDVMGGYKGEIVVAAGLLKYAPEYHKLQMTSPIIFCPIADFEPKIYTAYPKWSGFSDQWKRESIHTALQEGEYLEDLPEKYLTKYKLPSKKDALYKMHYPKTDMNGLKKALQRSVYEDLLYFACKLEAQQSVGTYRTTYSFSDFSARKSVERQLPYRLTTAQSKCLDLILENIKNKNRVHALIQGDVGCGKSIIAYMLMAVVAKNGYQSVIMAPTTVLAEQHFDELTKLLTPLGISVVYLGTSLSAAQRKKATKAIQSGEANVIVGTHAVMSAKVKYDNLAMILIDEEHRFGVKQRDALAQKAEAGVHQISFSATPIPRTLAKSLYGNETAIYEIKEMPPGRKPVQTEIVDYAREGYIHDRINQALSRGEQIYVVCPQVEDNDDDVKNVESVAKEYQKTFGTATVGLATGKMKKEDLIAALDDFRSGKKKILVSTTVVEVGVNVPSATLMIVEDAYRFGLASLHQLRGRVGRGDKEGHCILRSDRDCKRLNILCSTTDGFKIAEADMNFRGYGNLIGGEQSGNNRYMRLAVRYPNMFQFARRDATECLKKGWNKALEADIENRSQKVYIRPDKIKFFGET